MSNDERRDSLADQAAAWVPPWQREPTTAAPNESPAPQTSPTDSAPMSPPQEAPSDPPQETPANPPQEAPSDPPREIPSDPPREAPSDPPQETPSSPPTETPANPPRQTPSLASEEPAEREAVPAAVAEPAARPTTGGAGSGASTLALIDDAELRGALEAILLVVDEPVTEIILAQMLEQPTERVGATLTRIAEDYTAAGHGFELRRAAGGWRLYTRPQYAPYVERFVLDGQSVRLTQAALETLAVVAYKQPVTRSRISAIRGVNCDGVIRTLTSRGLVEGCGTEPESGAFLYRTTTLFLEKLGLDSVAELPPLAPFLPDDVEEIADAQR